MKISEVVKIDKPVEAVWKAITDFRNCSNYIEGIIKLEIIEEPKDTLVGLKWIETRIMYGKEATETMWITDGVENEFYQTQAESHGSVYVSKLSLKADGNYTQLTLSFSGKAQTVSAKILSTLMGFLIKGSMKKVIRKDLNDIKTHVESH
jgi:carbon monoxide dehydrogenase subunit G